MTRINTDESPAGRGSRIRRAAAGFLLASALVLIPAAGPAQDVSAPPPAPSDGPLLRFLGLTASPESIDYVVNKTPFQLHTLLTEQRHAKTWTLSEKIRTDTAGGLRLLFAVDADVTARLEELAVQPQALEGMTAEIGKALAERRRIFVYGCGATGRLAKQMESDFWRPFWRRVKAEAGIWAKVRPHLDPAIEESLIGEMTGADRALISSLEGFEDLPLIGRLQLQDRGILPGDVVIAVTEGGETSSVIGAVLGAQEQWKVRPGYRADASRKRLYFVYNNPDDRLRPFERSRRVLEEPGITKINLTTGPQAITGSTRMQAATIETFVIASVLETAAERFLRPLLSKKEMEHLGFRQETTLPARLRAFAPIQAGLVRQAPALAKLTDLEAAVYGKSRFATYFAETGLLTVFIDSTERSPTFRLYPLDTVREPKRKCWIQVWTDAPDAKAAWQAFLGRPFRGLNPGLYQAPFETQIDDAYLREKALASLAKAGDDQAGLYDFSFAGTNVSRRAPKTGDLAVLALIDPEPASLLNPGSAARRFIQTSLAGGAHLGLIQVRTGTGNAADDPAGYPFLKADPKKQAVVSVALTIDPADDPFGVRAQIGLKMLLNAHSTAVMAKLGKVVGNTMTNVSPSNLKLVGRATYLVQSQVNDVLAGPAWIKAFGTRKPVAYGEANAVLFDVLGFFKDKPQEVGQAAEVPVSIIRILESLRRKTALTNEDALAVYKKEGLAKFLAGAAIPLPAEKPADR
jgi:N-acetylmuramic acid 6-phosphate etherase